MLFRDRIRTCFFAYPSPPRRYDSVRDGTGLCGALSGLPPTLKATSLFTAGLPPKVNGLHSRMFSFWPHRLNER